MDKKRTANSDERRYDMGEVAKYKLIDAPVERVYAF